MSDLIDRDEVIEIIEYVCSADDTCWKPGTLEEIRNLPTHPTLSNTLGALDCVDRQEAIKALCREECGMDPKGCHVGTCYDVEIIEDVPSVQLELANNSPKLDKEIGECNDCIKHGGDWECDRVHCHKGDVPDTNVGELINRQDAIAEFSCCELTPDGGIDANYAIDFLKQLPSVQPRKGKWIEHDDGWANVYYECSVCKEPFVLIDGTPTENLYNFCPNCGCRMEEGDSE